MMSLTIGAILRTMTMNKGGFWMNADVILATFATKAIIAFGIIAMLALLALCVKLLFVMVVC